MFHFISFSYIFFHVLSFSFSFLFFHFFMFPFFDFFLHFFIFHFLSCSFFSFSFYFFCFHVFHVFSFFHFIFSFSEFFTDEKMIFSIFSIFNFCMFFFWASISLRFLFTCLKKKSIFRPVYGCSKCAHREQDRRLRRLLSTGFKSTATWEIC